MMRPPILIMALLVGCMFPTGGTGTNTRLLALNESKWHAAKVANYDFDYSNSCFCPPVDPARIEVREGNVSRVTSTKTGQVIILYWTPTIDSLFARSWRDAGYGYGLSFDFDMQLGYPKKIVGDVPDAVDDEYTIVVSNFIRR